MRMTSYTIALMCALALTSIAARAQTAAHLTFGINPTIFRAGQAASAELSVASTSVSTLTLSPGNTFLFIFDGTLGTVSSFTTPISVESSSLLAGDFSVSFGANQNQVHITYNGPAKPFAYGDSLSVKVSLMAGAQAGPGRVSLSSQFLSVVNGDLPFTTVSVVDFANSGTSAVAHDQTLMGDGTGAMPLGITPGGVTGMDLAPGAVGAGALATGAVSSSKIADGTVVRSLNSLTDNVALQAGSNITITPSGNTLTIAGTAPPGVVKAMLLVNADGTINLCFNSQLSGSDATTPPCGFSVSHPSAGIYDITFPFQVNTRFFSGTVAETTVANGMLVRPSAPQVVRAAVFYIGNVTYADGPFYLMVF
jgi:hypothetical protein